MTWLVASAKRKEWVKYVLDKAALFFFSFFKLTSRNVTCRLSQCYNRRKGSNAEKRNMRSNMHTARHGSEN